MVFFWSCLFKVGKGALLKSGASSWVAPTSLSQVSLSVFSYFFIFSSGILFSYGVFFCLHLFSGFLCLQFVYSCVFLIVSQNTWHLYCVQALDVLAGLSKDQVDTLSSFSVNFSFLFCRHTWLLLATPGSVSSQNFPRNPPFTFPSPKCQNCKRCRLRLREVDQNLIFSRFLPPRWSLGLLSLSRMPSRLWRLLQRLLLRNMGELSETEES